MTEGAIYSISAVKFASIHGLKVHTHHPKKLHDERVMDLP
jgi:hypothetical protein